MACLFACQDHITVHLRAPDKIGYVLGRFDGDEDSARAILDYAVLHAASEDGRVAYSLWPEGRSEERRVGKEGGSTCRSRRSPYPSKKKNSKVKNNIID